jgi:hypothetical protein
MTKVVIFDKCLKFELDIVLSEGTKWVHSPKFEYKCLRFAVPPLSELGISSGNWKGDMHFFWLEHFCWIHLQMY